MADPFSIAGSAVGVVSLGIKVCEDLVTFIGHVKDGKSEMSQISSRMDNLADCLERLQSSVNAVKPLAEGVAQEADAGISACATALGRIQEKLPQSNQPSGKGHFSRLLGEWKTRLGYPFRRAELFALKDMVESVQQNLIVALQALQLAQQQASHNCLSGELANFAQLTISDTQTIQRELTSLRSDVKHVGNAVHPVQDEVRVLTEQVISLTSSVMRLESRVTNVFPDAYSPSKIHKDARQLRHLHNRLRKTDSTSIGHAVNTSILCQCRGTTRARTLYSWSSWASAPFSILQETFLAHEEDCPYSAYSEARTSLQLRLSFCTFLFKRKVQLALQVQRGAGPFVVNHSLQTYRIVPESSAAFTLMDEFQNHIGELGAAQQYIRRLRELFGNREATPHDRLADGKTLLHALCSVISKYLVDWNVGVASDESPFAALIFFLVNAMGNTILEADDSGRSALDHFAALWEGWNSGIGHFDLGQSRDAKVSDYKTVVTSLNQKGILGEMDASTEILLSVLTKSRRGLQDAIRRHPNIHSIDSNRVWLSQSLRMSTVGGWTEGCEILIQHSALTAPGPLRSSMMTQAIKCNELSTVQFWLRQRRTANGEQLRCIGHIETALVLCSKRESRNGIRAALVKELVKQRERLKILGKTHLGNNKFVQRDDRLLDAGARRVFDALARRGVEVPASLRPVQASVYHSRLPLNITMAEELYSVGFRDVKASDFGRASNLVSPLIWNAASVYNRDRIRDTLSVCKWLISKGARLTETWPYLDMAAWKLLGYQAGRWMSSPLSTSAKDWKSLVLALLGSTYVDECSCACSDGGCSPLSSFFRGATESEDTRVEKRLLIFLLTSWIAPAARSHRHLVTALLRSLTFLQLGLRHTCCHIAPIARDRSGLLFLWKHDSTGLLTRICLGPCHDSVCLKEIREEDEYLLKRLEALVNKFDTAYDTQGQDIVDFVMGFWSERMLRELQEQAEMDKEEHNHGRRLLGITQHAFDPSVTGLVGEVNLDDFVFPKDSWYRPIKVSQILPSVRTLDELGGAFVPDDDDEEAEEERPEEEEYGDDGYNDDGYI